MKAHKTVKKNWSGSHKIAKELERRFGPPDPKDIIVVPMIYEKEVTAFLKKIEEAHKAAAKSKLRFGFAT